jgi:uncharacterized protein (DUF302 family)
MNESAVVTTNPGLSYGYSRSIDAPYKETLERTRQALQTEGFGVLCEIDMKEKLREKLGAEFRHYVILGACNPPMAYQALQEELNIGLLLPCNVVVYEEGARAVVAAIDAGKLLTIVGNPALQKVASQVDEKLRRAIDRV